MWNTRPSDNEDKANPFKTFSEGKLKALPGMESLPKLLLTAFELFNEAAVKHPGEDCWGVEL